MTARAVEASAWLLQRWTHRTFALLMAAVHLLELVGVPHEGLENTLVAAFPAASVGHGTREMRMH